jgi:hypothetical protein
MLRFTIVSHAPRPFATARGDYPRTNWTARLTEVEQDEARCLEAMLHWRDPSERSRTLHRRDHTLVDDNPASG